MKHRLRPQRSVSLLHGIIRIAMISRNRVIAVCTPFTVVSRSWLMSVIITFMFDPAKLQMNWASARGRINLRGDTTARPGTRAPLAAARSSVTRAHILLAVREFAHSLRTMMERCLSAVQRSTATCYCQDSTLPSWARQELPSPDVRAERCHRGLGALHPVAMERTLQLLEPETGIASGSFGIPCDSNGVARVPNASRVRWRTGTRHRGERVRPGIN